MVDLNERQQCRNRSIALSWAFHSGLLILCGAIYVFWPQRSDSGAAALVIGSVVGLSWGLIRVARMKGEVHEKPVKILPAVVSVAVHTIIYSFIFVALSVALSLDILRAALVAFVFHLMAFGLMRLSYELLTAPKVKQ